MMSNDPENLILLEELRKAQEKLANLSIQYETLHYRYKKLKSESERKIENLDYDYKESQNKLKWYEGLTRELTYEVQRLKGMIIQYEEGGRESQKENDRTPA